MLLDERIWKGQEHEIVSLSCEVLRNEEGEGEADRWLWDLLKEREKYINIFVCEYVCVCYF